MGWLGLACETNRNFGPAKILRVRGRGSGLGTRIGDPNSWGKKKEKNYCPEILLHAWNNGLDADNDTNLCQNVPTSAQITFSIMHGEK